MRGGAAWVSGWDRVGINAAVKTMIALYLGQFPPGRIFGPGAVPVHTMGQKQPIRQVTQGSEIPDKLYFRIGDVAKLCEVPAYVLRFWESEFPQLKPNKGGTGQRLYRRRDVEMALKIKKLLYDEGYTIPGARQLLKVEPRAGVPQLALAIDSTGANTAGAGTVKDTKRLEKLRKELEELHAMLSQPVAVVTPAPVQTIRAPKARMLSIAPAAPVAASPGLFDLYPELDVLDTPRDS
jgi:DNA-binding transcriptional MerR regulator